jgi:nicotinamidase-related amidase
VISVDAEPYEFVCDPAGTALLVIDMQRDFLERGGFGEMLGNNVALLRQAVAPTRKMLDAFRARGLKVIHTREGHTADLSDCPPSKRRRGRLAKGIGDRGPMGRILVRGEPGHRIIDQLRPTSEELVIDKPGKGAFYATELEARLRGRGVQSLVVTGVTTEVCVQSTVREANDRGFDCLVLEDCVASYFPELHAAALAMVKSQGGIFGWVAKSERLLRALEGVPIVVDPRRPRPASPSS